MSRAYIVSRNGGTVTKAPINDNKIPIYANKSAMEADLANIGENVICMANGFFYLVKTVGGVKTITQLTDKGYGLPLGTWISYEGTCPDGFIESGQSYNTSVYSALYAMLGSNTVPERFDHDRPSDYENITLSTDSNNPTVMQNDADIIFSVRDESGLTTNIYISQDNGATWKTISANRSNTDVSNSATTINLNKGDKIYYTPSSGITVTSYVRYYKRHLAIKATPAYVEPDTVSDMFNLLKSNLKAIVADSSDFADFKTKMANW